MPTIAVTYEWIVTILSQSGKAMVRTKAGLSFLLPLAMNAQNGRYMKKIDLD